MPGTHNTVLFYKGTVKFCVLPIWIDYIVFNDGKVEKKQFAMIGLKDIERDVHIIHPISEFIIENYGRTEYNTQRQHAKNVVNFLNYLLDNRRTLKLNSILELDISHAEYFLNNLTSDRRKRSTVKMAERSLTHLYKWLSNIDEIQNITNDLFVKKEGYRSIYYYESPFNNVIYPTAKANKLEHTLPYSYIPLLIEVAIQVAKPIALGLYFQLFGGLRVSEVVNVKRTQASRRINNGDFILILENQNFRPDLKGSSSVKKKRTQRVFTIKNWGNVLYRDHIRLYKPTDGSNALFVNRDGKAMSENSYRQYFNKVKKKFIEQLEVYGDIEQKLLAQHLKNMKWSTHIGRGTFTNMVAEHAANPYEVSFPRGDSGVESALTYIATTERMRKKLEQKFSDMHNEYIPRLMGREEGE